MSIGPTNNLSFALNFDLNTLYNNFLKPEYTITQIKQIEDLNKIIIDNNKRDIRPIVDKFSFGHKIVNHIPLP